MVMAAGQPHTTRPITTGSAFCPVNADSKTETFVSCALIATGGTATSTVSYQAIIETTGAIGTSAITVFALESDWATTATSDTSELAVTVRNW